MATDLFNPPCNIDEVVYFNFDSKNLEKYLDFLNRVSRNSLEIGYKLEKDLRKKMEFFSQLKEQVDDCSKKISAHSFRLGEFDISIENQANKTLELDEKLNGFNEEIKGITAVREMIEKKGKHIEEIEETNKEILSKIEVIIK